MSAALGGLSAWLVQRLSAIYMLFYSVMAAGWLLAVDELSYTVWQGLFAQPLIAIATAMFILALLLHAWVGVRDVILDYAGHFAAVRLTLLALLGAWLIVLGIWSAVILLTMVMP